MAEEKARILKVLEALSERTDPARPGDIGAIIGETPFFVGHDLFDLTSKGLAQKPDKEKNLYLITSEGRQTLENPPDSWLHKPLQETPPQKPPPGTPPSGSLAGESTIPSQADIFKSIGERLGFAKSVSDKRELSLGTVVDYVRSLADMDDLDSIERNLIEQNVPKDIRTRWLKLYAQSLPAKDVEMSPELKERLGLQEEEEKPARGGKRGPQFYNVVDGRMYPDPDGELTFSHALQQMAVEKGASATQAAELAASLAKTPTEIITTLLPLLTREPTPPPPQDTTMLQVLQQRIEQLADDKHKVELESLRAEMRSGQRSPETDQQIQSLSQQITDLREALHNQELARIQEQNQVLIGGLNAKLVEIEKQIAAGVQGKQAESKIGLMSETVKGIFEEAKGARQDIKSIAPTFLNRGAQTRKRTAGEKAGFGAGLGKGIEKAQAAGALEEELFFSGQAEGS